MPATQTITPESNTEPLEAAKARRNEEYLAKIGKAIKDLDEGRGITVTIEELETMPHA